MWLAGFDWDEANRSHIERHGFSASEVEEVFDSPYKVRRVRQDRYLALGETLDRRLAFVIFAKLPDGRIRVITARDMEDRERRQYRRK